MSIVVRLVLIVAGIALTSTGRAREGEASRPFLKNPLVETVFPTVILGLIAFGSIITVTELLK